MKSNKGFSLVELIIVISIMAVLMGVLAPTLVGNIEKSRESTDLQNIATIRKAMENVMADEEVYDEVMTKLAGVPLVIDLGVSTSVNIDGANLSGYPKLQKALKEAIPAEIDIKSKAAKNSGNHLLAEIAVDGNVSVYIASGSTASSDDAVACSKTTNADGTKKQFLISQ